MAGDDPHRGDHPAMPERVGNQPMPGGPLAGVRVIDAATLFAGPLAATFLGDFGAEVGEG